MIEREAFEAALKRIPLPAEYDDMDAYDQERWRGVLELVWQACRTTTIEECALASEELQVNRPNDNLAYYTDTGYRTAARAIRALASKEPT